jgi:hypothetical protein
MKATLKIPSSLLQEVRSDLARPHAHAHERVGFITAGACWQVDGTLLVLAADYASVEDDHYEHNPRVGAAIGARAFRSALQTAYTSGKALLHVHSHGRKGMPDFSRVDLASGLQFVPGFFSTISKVPHGMLVLSDTHATGLVWCNADQPPHYFSRIVEVGAFLKTIGGRNEPL